MPSRVAICPWVRPREIWRSTCSSRSERWWLDTSGRSTASSRSRSPEQYRAPAATARIAFADHAGGAGAQVGGGVGGVVVEEEDGGASGGFGDVGEVVGWVEGVDVDDRGVGEPGGFFVG